MKRTDQKPDRAKVPDFGVKLKVLREAAGMTQAQLAKASRLHLSVIFKIEQGLRRDPTWSTVQALAGALGVDFKVFADDSKRAAQRA
jgi:transcriptional regulator with XRE-family HTH domain